MSYRDLFIFYSGGMCVLGALLPLLAIPTRFGRIIGWENSLGSSTGWHAFVLSIQVVLLLFWLLIYPRFVAWALDNSP
jgi:hypothetical protein